MHNVAQSKSTQGGQIKLKCSSELMYSRAAPLTKPHAGEVRRHSWWLTVLYFVDDWEVRWVRRGTGQGCSPWLQTQHSEGVEDGGQATNSLTFIVVICQTDAFSLSRLIKQKFNVKPGSYLILSQLGFISNNPTNMKSWVMCSWIYTNVKCCSVTAAQQQCNSTALSWGFIYLL